MKKTLILLIILTIGLSFNPATNAFNARKNQTADAWQYLSNRRTINETVNDVFIFDGIAVASINTTRPMPGNFLSGHYPSFDLNMTEGAGNLLVTQSGSIPVAHQRAVVGSAQLDDKWYYFDKTTVTQEIYGDPAKGISTEEAIEYSLTMTVQVDHITHYTFYNTTTNKTEYVYNNIKDTLKFVFQQNFIISSLTAANNNFTVQRSNLLIWAYRNGSPAFYDYALWHGGLDLKDATIISYKFSLDKNFSSPIYLAQTQPVRVLAKGLSLSQSSGLTEYTMIRNSTILPTIISTNVLTKSVSLLTSSLIAIPIFAIIKKYNNK